MAAAKMRHSAMLSLLLATIACRQAPPVAAPEARRVENPSMGLAIAALPDGFDIAENGAERLEFTRSPDLPPGRAWIELGPIEQSGINLVDIVSGQKAAFEALPGGSFSGNRELQMPDGRPGYYSRGRFGEGDDRSEEFRVISLHPGANRLLRVVYRYPAGEDSAERLNDVLLLAGEIEALDGGESRVESGPD